MTYQRKSIQQLYLDNTFSRQQLVHLCLFRTFLEHYPELPKEHREARAKLLLEKHLADRCRCKP